MPQVSHRFGWDKPGRILTTTDYLTGGDEVPIPGEPVYQTLLPFPGVTGVGLPGGASSAQAIASWTQEPDRLDLSFVAGDDISIPLIFASTSGDLDMSTWAWYSTVRVYQSPVAPKIADFTCTAEYIPPSTTPGKTRVTLALPREDNFLVGNWYWDLQSISPADVPVDPADLTPGTAHTWIWGRCNVTTQVTIIPSEWPPPALQPQPIWLTVDSGNVRTVGPSGAVSG